MRGRWMRVLSVIVGLLIVGAPVAADDFTGSEREERTLPCPAEGESVPENQEPPGPGECEDAENPDETYQGYVWTNDVRCADGGQDLQVAKLYAVGDPGAMNGGAGICNDGSSVPIQGRVVVSGSQEQGGFTAYADGDKDNSPEQAQGFARLDAGTGGLTVRCGSEDGKMDASEPGPGDTQGNCG
jgi:hypothetical protein